MIQQFVVIAALVAMLLIILYFAFMIHVSSESQWSGHIFEKRNPQRYVDVCAKTALQSFSLLLSTSFVCLATGQFFLATSSATVSAGIWFILGVLLVVDYVFALEVYQHVVFRYDNDTRKLWKDARLIVSLKTYQYLVKGRHAELFE